VGFEGRFATCCLKKQGEASVLVRFKGGTSWRLKRSEMSITFETFLGDEGKKNSGSSVSKNVHRTESPQPSREIRVVFGSGQGTGLATEKGPSWENREKSQR